MSNGIEDSPLGNDESPRKGPTVAKDLPQAIGDIQSRGDGDRQADTPPPEQAANNIPPTGAEDQKNGESPQISNNQSLRNLLQYDSDSSTSSEMELNMRWPTVHESDQSSTSTEDEDDDDDDESDEDDISVIDTTPQSKGAIKKQMNIGNHNLTPKKIEVEEGIDKLEPVPDLSRLNINSEEDVFEHMGNVLGVVDRLVTIGALPNQPAYDLDTLLFLDEGKRPLGFVFDVLGQVSSPIYAVRFNAVEDIKNLQIANGTKVYAAPNSKHTQYVFLSQLLKMKGTDASWLRDEETPSEFVDYSDDENEYYATRALAAARAAGGLNHADFSFAAATAATKRSSTGSDGSSGSDTYKRFENTMNKRNLLNTKFNNYIDSYKQARRRASQRQLSGGGAARRAAGGAPQIPIAPSAGAATALLPPSFDPTVPPPNMFSPPAFYPTTPPVAHMVGPYHNHHHHMPFAPPPPHGVAVPSPFRHSTSPSSSSSTNTSPYSSPQTGMFTPPNRCFVYEYLRRSPVVGGDNNNTRRLPPPPSVAAAGSASLPPSAAPLSVAPPLNFIPGNFINPALLALSQSPSLSLLPPPPHQLQQQQQQQLLPPVLLMQQPPPLEPTNFAGEFPPPGPSHQ